MAPSLLRCKLKGGSGELKDIGVPARGDSQFIERERDMGKLFTRDAKAVENSRVHYDEVAKSTSMEWRVAEIGAGPVPVFSKAPRHPITPTT